MKDKRMVGALLQPECPSMGNISPAELANLAGVTIRTARRWLNDKQSMSRAHAELVALKLAGAIVPAAWRAQDIHFFNDALQLPRDAQTFSLDLLRTYWILIQKEVHWRAEARQWKEYARHLETLLPRAEVVDWPGHRAARPVRPD